MDYYVYILAGKDNYLYTGITWNLNKRLYDHNYGIRSGIPNKYKPLKIVYTEKFSSKIKAAKREKEIKGWRREKKLELIKSLH